MAKENKNKNPLPQGKKKTAKSGGKKKDVAKKTKSTKQNNAVDKKATENKRVDKNKKHHRLVVFLVDDNGFEPLTLRTSSACSTS